MKRSGLGRIVGFVMGLLVLSTTALAAPSVEVDRTPAEATAALPKEPPTTAKEVYDLVRKSSTTSGKVSPTFLPAGCVAVRYLQHENADALLTAAKSWVACTPDKARSVKITLKVFKKALQSGASWTQVGRDYEQSCRLGIWPLVCSNEVPFPFNRNATNPVAPDRTFLYRMDATVNIDGITNGIPIPSNLDSQWVVNRSGLPYPDNTFLRPDAVPFPTYVGPWTGGDTRDTPQFNSGCDDMYRARGWWPLPYIGEPYNHHHIWPLGHGGRNDAGNCYILPYSLHLQYNSFWSGFLP